MVPGIVFQIGMDLRALGPFRIALGHRLVVCSNRDPSGFASAHRDRSATGSHTPPRSAALSITTTSCPRALNVLAAASPLTPAPMTHTFFLATMTTPLVNEKDKTIPLAHREAVHTLSDSAQTLKIRRWLQAAGNSPHAPRKPSPPRRYRSCCGASRTACRAWPPARPRTGHGRACPTC